MNVICIGEVLWDVAGQRELLGGAALNFAIHLSRLGHRVSLVSAVGNDERGRRIIRKLEEAGLSSEFIHQDLIHPTGWVDVRFDAEGEPEYEIHRPAAYDFPALSEEQLRQLFSTPVDWVYFGTLQQMSPIARKLTNQLILEASAAKRFYDPNLRPNSFSPETVRDLLERATVVKLSKKEAEAISSMCGTPGLSLEDFCRTYQARFGWEAVCITRGPVGCVALIGARYVEEAGYDIGEADPVGAGDAFAAAFLHGIAAGWLPGQIADFANRLGALVVSRSGAVPGWTIEEANALQRKAGRRE